MADRTSTPYVAAVVEEIMRHCPMYYTNAAHSSLEETELGGKIRLHLQSDRQLGSYVGVVTKCLRQ